MSQRKHAPSAVEGFDIDHLAELARIELTPKEKIRFTAEIGRILTHVEHVRSVDTAGVSETAQVTGLLNVFQEPKHETSVKNQDSRFPATAGPRHSGAGKIQDSELGALRRRRDEFLAGAVETKAGFVKIPAIFGESDESDE